MILKLKTIVPITIEAKNIQKTLLNDLAYLNFNQKAKDNARFSFVEPKSFVWLTPNTIFLFSKTRLLMSISRIISCNKKMPKNWWLSRIRRPLRLCWNFICSSDIENKILKCYTVNPELAATTEYNDHNFKVLFWSFIFVINIWTATKCQKWPLLLCTSQGWLLYTGLTV